MSTRSKWLEWKSSPQGPSILEKTSKYELTKTTETAPILGQTPRTEPTNTTETILGVFVASPLANSKKIEVERHQRVDQDESDTLRECKSDAATPTAALTEPTQEQIDAAGRILAGAGIQQAEPSTLKGQAVELGRDGRRFFLVADEQDAQEAIQRFGAHRGEVWTSSELELVASIPDQATRDEIEEFKRQLDGSLSPGAAGKGVSAAEWQAQILNQLFKEQGVTGQPGKIQPETVEHGMKGKLK